MADEIRNQNVVVITHDGRFWCARIGPDDLGLAAKGVTPASSVFNLGQRMSERGWLCDPHWRPRPLTFHDA